MHLFKKKLFNFIFVQLILFNFTTVQVEFVHRTCYHILCCTAVHVVGRWKREFKFREETISEARTRTASLPPAASLAARFVPPPPSSFCSSSSNKGRRGRRGCPLCRRCAKCEVGRHNFCQKKVCATFLTANNLLPACRDRKVLNIKTILNMHSWVSSPFSAKHMHNQTADRIQIYWKLDILIISGTLYSSHVTELSREQPVYPSRYCPIFFALCSTAFPVGNFIAFLFYAPFYGKVGAP